MKHTLEIDSVLLDFKGRMVLQNVYLKCETGQVTGLLGRNGEGKSSLMKIIFGELSPIDKSVRIDNCTLLGGHRNPNDIKYLSQTHFVPGSLKVKRTFDDFKVDYNEFQDAFPEFNAFYYEKVKKLSGGLRRLLEVYLIIKSKTKFCLLDEPFTHIMPKHVMVMKSLIHKEKENKGIVVSDHLYKDIMDISDTIYLIKDGRVFPVEGTDELKKQGYITGNFT